jgi:hypothetical protein
VSAEMIQQEKDMKEIKTLLRGLSSEPSLSLEELLVNFFNAKKMIRLLRSPTQIAHCEVKSNRVGLAYVVKV